MSESSGNDVRTQGDLQHQLGLGDERSPLECGVGSQPARYEPRRQEITEGPAWIERQRLRRVWQALETFDHTRSEFLLDWARKEVLHMVRDA